jgi:hypothetical protein
VNVVPLLTVPPVDTSYQFIVPASLSLLKLGRRSRNVKCVVEDIVGVMVTVAVTAVRVALLQAAVLLQHNKVWLNQYWEL